VISGKELNELRDNLSLSSFAPQFTVWNPRAVIRLGFLLRDSKVAAKVRTVSLNVLQGVADHKFSIQFSIVEGRAVVDGNFSIIGVVSRKGLKINLVSYQRSTQGQLQGRYKNMDREGDTAKPRRFSLIHSKSWSVCFRSDGIALACKRFDQFFVHVIIVMEKLITFE
jgi:hypothetical protein